MRAFTIDNGKRRKRAAWGCTFADLSRQGFGVVFRNQFLDGDVDEIMLKPAFDDAEEALTRAASTSPRIGTEPDQDDRRKQGWQEAAHLRVTTLDGLIETQSETPPTRCER